MPSQVIVAAAPPQCWHGPCYTTADATLGGSSDLRLAVDEQLKHLVWQIKGHDHDQHFILHSIALAHTRTLNRTGRTQRSDNPFGTTTCKYARAHAHAHTHAHAHAHAHKRGGMALLAKRIVCATAPLLRPAADRFTWRWTLTPDCGVFPAFLNDFAMSVQEKNGDEHLPFSHVA